MNSKSERLSDINYDNLVEIGNEALFSYHRAVERERPPVRVIGVCIVGSVLTDNFDPETSDIDVYFVTNGEYTGHEDSFWQMVNTSNEFQSRLQNATGRKYSEVDTLGTINESNVEDKIRDPSKKYIR